MAIETLTYILASIASSGLVGVLVVYRGLVRVRSSVVMAWRNVQALFRQRCDTLRTLRERSAEVANCPESWLRALAEMEEAALSVAGAGPGNTTRDDETRFRARLSHLRELEGIGRAPRANPAIGEAVEQVSDITHAIPGRIRFYYESVRQHNERIDRFPDWIVARLVGFGRASPI
ncbi:MAG: LemA family protein [Panacagrimonas sp.]